MILVDSKQNTETKSRTETTEGLSCHHTSPEVLCCFLSKPRENGGAFCQRSQIPPSSEPAESDSLYLNQTGRKMTSRLKKEKTQRGIRLSASVLSAVVVEGAASGLFKVSVNKSQSKKQFHSRPSPRPDHTPLTINEEEDIRQKDALLDSGNDRSDHESSAE